MRTEKRFSVVGLVGSWMCLAGLAGMAGMFATGIFAPQVAATVAPAAMDRAVVATFVLFTLGFTIWMFEPEARSSLRFWKWGCLLSLVAAVVPVVLFKRGM